MRNSRRQLGLGHDVQDNVGTTAGPAREASSTGAGPGVFPVAATCCAVPAAVERQAVAEPLGVVEAHPGIRETCLAPEVDG
ncbi:hypothetical protein RHODO2019_02010 [Rhodococcus antarcticus]|uniref:Uncharacterized protein n=1 Tax=Rhodococcus antarcticus TaxID=2987751 RepID=A0ABY6P0V6_9NOCA|nr:hypothetical protein [Rhodococcus antarcticus]UZJ25282.1 hypothetical protein RHODO2019_02010 [Rhodococcus antarcticus]